MIEKTPVDERNRPGVEVNIDDCGVLEMEEPFSVTKEDADENA